ncbi:hypothetical protein C8F04DRAFT_32655 [Mycena alexandri]|uniref:Zinc-ribbon 15 domain-containing protein n=1 Tax=Mycena alexandri TaxID=1745969 RepID=A0AAD6TF99_9AGAR|nr:hypothetical protein C8F04DRAFT_32655 [Mycena alexandri]
MFFCLPILIGCQQKLKPEGDLTPHICPNCHNASVFSAKKTTWFEFFFIPLVPLSAKHIWLCQICHWMAPHAAGQFEPAVASGFPQTQPSYQGGYQPGYVNQVQPTPPNTYQPVYLQGSMQK